MRLIDADELIKKQHTIHVEVVSYSHRCIDVQDIDDIPTVDAVPVVRCKDCKYWWKTPELCKHERHCDLDACVHQCNADDFCSDGEKK